MSPTLADRIVAEARSWAGTPYRHQASLRGVGCDCLGLLRGVWRGVLGPERRRRRPMPPPGPNPPRATISWRPARRHLVPVATPLPAYVPQAGDVLLFAFRAHLPAKHCAIATGPAAMIHAHDGAAVTEVALTPWWRRHLAGAFRFPSAG